MAKKDPNEAKPSYPRVLGNSVEDSERLTQSPSGTEEGGESFWEKWKSWMKSMSSGRRHPLGDSSLSRTRRKDRIRDFPDIIPERLRALGKRFKIPDNELAGMARLPRSQFETLLVKYGVSPREAKAVLNELGKVGEDLLDSAKKTVAEKASKGRTILEKVRVQLDQVKDRVFDKETAHGSSSAPAAPSERHLPTSGESSGEETRTRDAKSRVQETLSQWWDWVASLAHRWLNRLLESLQYLLEKLKRLLIILLWLLLIICLCVLAVWLLPHLVAVTPPHLLPWIGLGAAVVALILAAIFWGREAIWRWLSRLTSFVLSVLTGRFFLKLLAYVLAIALCALSLSVLYYRYDAKAVNQLKALIGVNPLPEAKSLVAEGRYCDALEYLDYFREYEYVRNNPEISAFYDQVRQERDSLWFSVRDALEGVWRGKGACYESLVAATVSDFFVVGDLRDLILEGSKWYNGEETDEFVVGLATAGVILSAPTYAGGAGAPAKGSLSLLKVAKRLERIPIPLQKELIIVFRETGRMRSVEPIRPLVGHLSSLKDVPHVKTRDFLGMLSKCSSISDLKLMREAALVYGNNTGKVMKLGGDAPFQMLKKCGGDVNLSKAMDQSLQYGRKGTQVLGELGPTRFLRLLTLAKYGVRAGRSLWQHRLTLVAAWLLSLLPEWAIWTAAILSGLVVIGWPALGITRLVWSRSGA